MCDLHTVLPDFSTADFTHLLRGLEKSHITTTDLLTLDVSEIGKRAQLPLLDLKRLSAAVLNALHTDLGVINNSNTNDDDTQAQDAVPTTPHPRPRPSSPALVARSSHLDTHLFA